MDAIVNRLAEIESAAAAIVKHAEEEKDELESGNAAETDKI